MLNIILKMCWNFLPKAILMVGGVLLDDVLFVKQLPSILVSLACGNVIQVVPLSCSVNNIIIVIKTHDSESQGQEEVHQHDH